jgi:hypothetical protein
MQTQSYTEMIISAIKGYEAEHGVYPDYILMTADVARSTFNEVNRESKYKDLVKINGALQVMKIMVGPDGVEVAQIAGINRIELASDLTVAGARKALGRGKLLV